MIKETIEQWVERVKTEPIWREVAVLIDQSCFETKREKATHLYATTLKNGLSEAFASDVFSLHWLKAPQTIELSISSDVIRHANMVILHSRQEVTEGVPEKEYLWRALRSLFEEAERLQKLNIGLEERNIYLEERIIELEEK